MLRKYLSRAKYPQIPKQVNLRELIQLESQVGSALFGALSAGRKRQFFMLDEQTWIWYEEWTDHVGVHRFTTRYELHRDNILKIQNQNSATIVSADELDILHKAIKEYYYAIADKVYNRPISA